MRRFLSLIFFGLIVPAPVLACNGYGGVSQGVVVASPGYGCGIGSNAAMVRQSYVVAAPDVDYGDCGVAQQPVFIQRSAVVAVPSYGVGGCGVGGVGSAPIFIQRAPIATPYSGIQQSVGFAPGYGVGGVGFAPGFGVGRGRFRAVQRVRGRFR